MMFFFSSVHPSRLRKVLVSYAFRKSEQANVVSFKKNFPRIEKALSKKRLSVVKLHRVLDPLSYEVILLSYVVSKKKLTRQRIKEFFFKHHHKKLSITGEDLPVATRHQLSHLCEEARDRPVACSGDGARGAEDAVGECGSCDEQGAE